MPPKNKFPQLQEWEFFKAIIDDDIPLVQSMLDEHPKAVLWHQEDQEGTGEETTGLMYAASRGNKEMVSLLLERGAEMEGKDRTLGTALVYAIERGSAEVVEFLLQRGASTDVRSFFAMEGTPLALALKAGREDIAGLVRRAPELCAHFLAACEEEKNKKIAQIGKVAASGIQKTLRVVKSIRFK